MKKKDKSAEEVVEKDVVETTEEQVAVEEVAEEVVETTEETVEEVEEKDPVEALQEELAIAKDKELRLQAEFQNFRMRTSKDLRNSREAGVIDTIMPFLQVYDHMKMASMSIENGDNIDAIRQGVTMILNEFKRAISELSVEEVDAIGEAFDPNVHAAVAHEASEDVEEGKVVKQWSTGYRKGERLLKPAKVVVSSGPEKEAEVATEETAEESGE